MKNLFISALALLLFISENVVSQHQFDTLFVKTVAKGVKHLSIEEPNLPWTLNVLDVNLSKAVIKIEAAISRDKTTGHEKTSSMANRFNKEGHHVVGAINGGFFDGNGHDVGMQIREGELITQNNHWSAIGFDINKNPFIQRLTLNSSILLKDKTTSKKIDGINKTRETDNLIFFNSYYGANTNTNIYGTEVLIEPLSHWLVNDTIACVVKDKKTGIGKMPLPKGSAVLSGHGTSKNFLDTNIGIGDTLFVIHKIAPAPSKIVTLLNGYPKIVKGGKNCALDCYAEEGGSNTFATARHPRTAAGFSKDGQHLYLVTVDGRQKTSVGMSLPELADFLVGIGAYRAVNLDGGGSTTMVVRNKIVNSPSDKGGERSVANCLMIISEDTKGNLSQIRLNTEYAKVFAGNTYRFTAEGFDEFYNSVPINSSNVIYSLSNAFGTITKHGLFTAGKRAATGYVIAEYEGMKDSACVVVNSISKLEILPKTAVTDTSYKIQFKVNAFDVYGNKQNFTCSDYSWESTNSNVGTIDSAGKFTGILSGITQVIVRWNDVVDTATVNVKLKEGELLLNEFNNINDWNLSGENIDTFKSSIIIDESVFTQGNSSLKLDYNFTYHVGVQHWAYLNTDIPIDGVPVNFQLDVSSETYKHMVALIVKNNNNEEFALVTKGLNAGSNFDTLTASLTTPIPLEKGNMFYYPLKISKIAVLLNSSRKNDSTYTGTIRFDNLRVIYSSPSVAVKETTIDAATFKLYQNYPNPFNPETVIEYSVSSIGSNRMSKVKLTVYNIVGEKIRTLVDTEQPAGFYKVHVNFQNMASGVYLYSLQVNNSVKTEKMLLLK